MIQHRQTVLFLGDVAAFVLAYCTMAVLRFDVGAQGAKLPLQLGLFALIFALWLTVLFIFDLYTIRRINPNPRNIGLLILAMLVNGALAALAFYFAPSTGISPKTNLIILTTSALVFLIAWRRLFYLLFTRTFVRTIGIIGTGALIEHLKADLAAHPYLGRVIAHYDTPNISADERINLLIADNVPPGELFALARSHNVETLTLAQAYETLFGKIPLELMTDQQALRYVTAIPNPATYALYRMVEILVASIILIITSPFLLIAIIARLIEDGHPVFYTQTRVGKDGKQFRIYKLRSMIQDAEKNGATWATAGDARITTLGRILRATHIDEVPQMWNIIKGDIALVGPRPERPEFVAELETQIPYYYLRHSIRPGFTGWAQIKFRYARSVMDSREKFEYDLYYVVNRNPVLDMGIFLKTIQIIFTH